MEAGHYQFNSLTVADGGEITSTESSDDQRYFTLSARKIHVQGGGTIHNVEMVINAEDLTVNDLGRLVADDHTMICGDTSGGGRSSSDGASGTLSVECHTRFNRVVALPLYKQVLSFSWLSEVAKFLLVIRGFRFS